MEILDRAVAVMGKRGVDGARISAQLEQLAGVGDQAVKIWQAYVDRPETTGDKYSLVTWMGPQPARELYELGLKARSLVDAICAAAGPEARFLVMDENPIVMAYVGLREGETGPQAAAERMTQQQERNHHFRDLANRVRALKPGKSGGTSAAGRTKPSARKKAASGKKAVAKAVKRMKRPAAKKSAKATRKSAKKKK